MSIQKTPEADDDYRIRWYESGDREQLLGLFAAEWGDRPSAAWFDWKFVDDPFLSHVPLNVAERDGEIVGAQAYVLCPLRYGDVTVMGLKPADAVVHSDHRRQGLYTRITAAAIDRYESGDPALFFNFPNAASLGAQEKLGWSSVRVVPTWYRLQRPGSLQFRDGLTGGAGRLVDAAAGAYFGVRDRLRDAPGEFEVTRHDSVPADAFASLYESGIPGELHADRTAAFYRWFFDAPDHDHTAYVARRNGRPVAGLITRTEDGETVDVMEAVPLESPDPVAVTDALAAVVADNADAAAITVTESTLPGDVLRRFGFVSDDAPVVSRVSTPTYMAARPLWSDGEPHALDEETVTSPQNWRVSLTEVRD